MKIRKDRAEDLVVREGLEPSVELFSRDPEVNYEEELRRPLPLLLMASVSKLGVFLGFLGTILHVNNGFVLMDILSLGFSFGNEMVVFEFHFYAYFN